VQGYDGREGLVWCVEDGRLTQRRMQFRHRTEDARLEVVSRLPDGVRIVSRLVDGMRAGRSVQLNEASGQ